MASVSFDFSGECVLVTGASRGIGETIALSFARAGADVIVLANDDAVYRTADKIAEEAGRKVTALRCDITNHSEVTASIKDAPAIDVLVNNAGLERITPILDPGPEADEAFRRIVDTNLMGTYYVTREVVRRMQPGARILMTSSIWGRVAVPEFSAYCATKHAIVGFTRSIAHELGPRHIRVNAVCPGWVRTGQSERSLEAMADRSGRGKAELLDEITAAQVFPGLMEPADVADLYLFLASPSAASITGQAIVIDRGEVMA